MGLRADLDIRRDGFRAQVDLSRDVPPAARALALPGRTAREVHGASKRSLGTLDRSARGTIALDGTCWTRRPARPPERRPIGVCFQD